MAHPDEDQIVSGHLDEGTVHAWLDGQLPAADVARVESHVAGCATCQARVAEARGFIAASSRILTALDGVPARVIPTRRRGVQLWHVRAAAAALIVALGTATVLHEVRVPEFSPSRELTLSDSQASMAAKKAEKAIAPSAAPLPAAVLPKKAAVREETPPLVSKAAASAAERDQITTSGIRDKRSGAAAASGVPQRAENKEKADETGAPGGSPPVPEGAPVGAVGGAAAQSIAPAAPAIAGRLAAPAPGAPSVQLRRRVAGAPERNSVAASDSGTAPRPSRAAVMAVPLQGASGACVGQVVSVSASNSGNNEGPAQEVVRLGSLPSTDSLFPGFALAAPSSTGIAPTGAWTALGPDSAIVSVPSEGGSTTAQLERRVADSVATAAPHDRQIVRTRVQCPPR